jgi:hypothetical protein
MSEANGWRERMDRFELGMEHLLQGQAGHDERLTRLEAAMDRHEAAIERLISSQQHLITAQVTMADSFSRLSDRVDKVALSVGELAEAGKRTDERLSALIGVVDDIVRRDHRV